MRDAKTNSFTDRRLLICLLILLAAGFLALISASGPVGYSRFGDAYFFVKRQFLYGLLPGALAFIVLSKLGHERLRALSWPFYGLTLVLLVLAFIPKIGVAINNTHGWINLFGFAFQPSEFAKLAVIMLAANVLTVREHDWRDWQNSLLPILAALAPAVLLVLLQPDLGTASILIAIIFIMFYSARVPARYLAILTLAGVLGFLGLVLSAPYRAERITTFLHPELDPQGVGYQMNQSFLAVGSGGWWGLGYGQSRQKYQYLPEVSADSIFAVVAEENGFFVSMALILLILLVGWRVLKIAKNCLDPHGQLLAAGVAAWFLWQSFLNIGASVGALPLTGVPLPLVSHGGSALASILAGFGVVASVSKAGRVSVNY